MVLTYKMYYYIILQSLLLLLIINYYFARDKLKGDKALCLLSTHKSGTLQLHDLKFVFCDVRRYSGYCGNNTLIENLVEGFRDGRAMKLCTGTSDKIVYAIRHPIDMVLSGYFYHKDGKETWTTSQGYIKSMMHIPREFPINGIEGSYSNWLHTHTEEEGLRMELLRTLHAAADMGTMFQDMLYLKTTLSYIPVFYLCMATNYLEMPALDIFISDWRSTNKAAPLHTSPPKNHGSNQTDEERLFPIAARLVAELVPAELLQLFPCTSRYFWEAVSMDPFITNLEVEDNTLLLNNNI